MTCGRANPAYPAVLELGRARFPAFGSSQTALAEGPACLPVLEIGLQLILGELHSAHLGRLLLQFVPKRRHGLVATFNFRTQDLALVPSIAHLLQQRHLIRFILIARD